MQKIKEENPKIADDNVSFFKAVKELTDLLSPMISSATKLFDRDRALALYLEAEKIAKRYPNLPQDDFYSDFPARLGEIRAFLGDCGVLPKIEDDDE